MLIGAGLLFFSTATKNLRRRWAFLSILLLSIVILFFVALSIDQINNNKSFIAQNIHSFQYLINGFSCIARHERFCCRIDDFFGILTSQKYLLMTKILIIFLNKIGIILTPIYSLSMLWPMFYGYKLFNTPNSYFFILVRENYLFRFLSLNP
ncbi:hypothetical protein AHAS_Ahas15G0331000 [Arachis hypogaea]